MIQLTPYLKKIILFCCLFPTFTLVACNSGTAKNDNSTELSIDDSLDSKTADYYLRVEDSEELYSGYINLAGDTIIPIGKYETCLTDTFETYALVLTQKYEWIGIDRDENKLYDVFIYDNGPDYIVEGLFRIEKEGKIGFANAQTGEIVIEPKYSFALPFENGRSQVTLEGEKKWDGEEHWFWDAEEWFFIDKNGKRLDE